MDIYASDEEKSEAIKQWWRDNGMAVAVGVALGIAAIFGSRYWFNYQAAQSEQAAGIYQQALVTMNDGDLLSAESTINELKTKFSSSPYAAFAATELATQLASNDDLSASMQQLQWVIDNAELAGQRDLARLRLGRMSIDAGDFATAHDLIETAETQAYASLLSEMQGDLYDVQGKPQKAFEAYQNALSVLNNNEPRYSLLQMKRDDVIVE